MQRFPLTVFFVAACFSSVAIGEPVAPQMITSPGPTANQPSEAEANAASERNSRADDQAIRDWLEKVSPRVVARTTLIIREAKTDVQFRIEWRPTGEITDVILVNPSGIEDIDQRIINAISKLSPLPSMENPDAYGKLKDIVFRIPPPSNRTTKPSFTPPTFPSTTGY